MQCPEDERVCCKCSKTIEIILNEEEMKMMSMSQWREDMTVWPGGDKKCTKERIGVILLSNERVVCKMVII